MIYNSRDFGFKDTISGTSSPSIDRDFSVCLPIVQVDSARCSRKIYPIVLGVCSVALIAGSVLCMIVSPQASRSLSSSFNRMFDSARSSPNGTSRHVDQLQRERECCGIRPHPADAYTMGEPIKARKLLPQSCCPPKAKSNYYLEEEVDDTPCQWWKSYKANCLIMFRYTFDRAINNVAMWALSVVTFLIVAVILIICTTPR
ncbi:unnamed protein product [Nesidiocoris tenuis]|uniref:Tetraspanin n=1 Tax=Nesidiocoris tenuis TaxID=355587 RepID=A0A6H5HE65_9HEMI|nr:unnamed protein product [Nesidiocoris tenuis]